MRIYPAEKVYVRWFDAIFTADPTPVATLNLVVESTEGVEVAGSPFTLVWSSAAVLVGSASWTRSARSQALFVGSGLVPAGGEVGLGVGRWIATPYTVWPDGQRIAGTPTPIDVLA